MSARFAGVKQVQWLWCILGYLLVVVEEARTHIQIAFPAGKSWVDDSSLVQRFCCINQRFRGNADLTAQAIAFQTHALGIVERKRICRAHVGFTDARKEQAQPRRDVSNRAHRRVRSPTQAFLINNHGHAQVLNRISVWLGIARQQVTNEHAKILKQQSLCFVGNGVKHHGGLPRTRYTGKNDDVALGQPQRDILQIVLAGATNLDIFLNHADLCSLRIFSPRFPWLALSERLCSGPSRLRSWRYQGAVEHSRIGTTSSLSYGRCAEEA